MRKISRASLLWSANGYKC